MELKIVNEFSTFPCSLQIKKFNNSQGDAMTSWGDKCGDDNMGSPFDTGP